MADRNPGKKRRAAQNKQARAELAARRAKVAAADRSETAGPGRRTGARTAGTSTKIPGAAIDDQPCNLHRHPAVLWGGPDPKEEHYD